MSFLSGLLLATVLCPMLVAGADFSVSLKTDKSEYLVGEPVAVSATVSYSGSVPLEFNDPRDPGQYVETLEIAHMAKDPQFRKFVSRAEAADAKAERGQFPAVVFNTGTQIDRNYFIHGWPKDFAPGSDVLVFAKPGVYVVRFTARFNSEIASEETLISINEPTTDADKGAWKWLQQNDRLEKFCDLDTVPKEATDANKAEREKLLKPFEDLMKQFPDSVYAKYVRSVAGKFFDTPEKP